MQQIALRFPDGAGGEITVSSLPQGGFSFLNTLLNNAITIFFVLGALLLVIYIVWGGLQWETSGGEKAKVAAARAKITWAIIGFIILLSSFFIISIISYLFKVKLLTF